MKYINVLVFFRNEEELPEQWKQSIIIMPLYTDGDNTDCINYGCI
jgi:hypothetical protein